MIGNLTLKTLVEPWVAVPWSSGIDGLDREMDLSLYRLPHPEGAPLSEFVITPFERETWKDVWIIRMITREQAGILARIATFLRERKINILTMTSGTINQARFHAATLLVDCSRYDGPDRLRDARSAAPTASLNRLQREFALEFIYDLRFFDPTYPSLSIERCMPLWRQHKDIMELEQAPAARRLRIENGHVEIPAEELHQNRRAYAARFAMAVDDLGPSEALVSTSEGLEVVRIFLFFKNLGIVPIAVTFDNRAGAIAAMAECLSHGKINVLASRAWTVDSYRRNRVWMLVRDHSQRRFPVDDRKAQGRIRRMLGREGKFSEFNPEFSPIA